MNSQKQGLRKELLKKRMTMDAAIVHENSQIICDRLVSVIEKTNISGIIFYYPLKNEVNLLPAIHTLINDSSKTIGFPHFNGETYAFGRVNHQDFDEKWEFYSQFFSGKYGVREPKHVDVWPSDLETLILVPGLAFDRAGHRLGFGKGNYDKLLVDYPGKKLGVCFNWQLIDKCPTDSHDVAVDDVLTEKGFLTS